MTITKANQTNILLSILLLFTAIAAYSVFTYYATMPSKSYAPEYVSTRSNTINVRSGPGKDYPIKWTYVKRGVPLKIQKEYKQWYQIADMDGTTGWVFKSLTLRNTNIMTHKDTVLYNKNQTQTLAKVSKSAILKVKYCDNHTCKVSAKGVTGWIDRSDAWGEVS